MIKRIDHSSADSTKLAEIEFDKQDISNDFYDYSKVIVKKPWGQEYLIFENNHVAIWILQIKKGAQTSMHCHPNKKTSLVVLQGNVVCSTLEKSYHEGPNGGLMIPKGAFHQTAVPADATEDAWVMEIESPVNKRDLIRLKDKYGRVGQGYEKKSHYSTKLQNYNYLTLSSSKAYHNLQKRFENSSLSLYKITSQKELDELLQFDDADVLSMLSGKLARADESLVVEVGDTMSMKEFKKEKALKYTAPLEILMVKKIDKVWKVSDYLVSFLKSQNVKDIFLVPGDSNVHLLDSIGKDEAINYFSNQTERSASLAAESYAKLTNNLGVMVISSGGCGPNTLPGVANAWIDSTPMLIISGQARSDQDFDGKVRQLGNKALNIIDIARPITKYAVKVSDPKEFRYHLEQAVYLAKSGRPGPVWIDLPIDIQGMLINTDELSRFTPPEPPPVNNHELEKQVDEIMILLKKSQRPVLIVGNGVRLSGAQQEILKLIDQLQIPVLTTRKGSDLITSEHKYYFGRSGVFGQRRGNFIVQNSDLILGIGARFSIPQIGRGTDLYARSAKKIIVDIDQNELDKETLKADLRIKSDAKFFIDLLLEKMKGHELQFKTWVKQCQHWNDIFNPLKEGYAHKTFVNLYLFIDELSKVISSQDNICVDGCTLMNTMMHIFNFKQGQRLIGSTGIELPGFSVSGAIGVAIAQENKVICLTEAQGFFSNTHELQTIVENGLGIKIFVFQNNSHSHIRKIQEDHFASRFVGTDTELKKVSPEIATICEAFKIGYKKIQNPKDLNNQIKDILSSSGPVVCEVSVDPDQELVPRVGFTITDSGKWIAKPLEDMQPYMNRDLLKKEMLIPLVQE